MTLSAIALSQARLSGFCYIVVARGRGLFCRREFGKIVDGPTISF